MKRANRLMLVIGVALAALSFIAVLSFGGFGSQNAVGKDPDVPVVMTTADLPLGSQVMAAQLTTTTMKQSQATGTYQTTQEVVGKVVRRAVTKGTALTSDDFSTAVSVPDLVQSLAPGLRAIAVPLDTVNSVAGLLQSGDRVDVLLSMEDLDGLNPISIANPDQSPSIDGTLPDPYVSIDDVVNNTTVKVVLQNVQVLATIASAPVDDTGGSSNSQASPAPAAVVLLAVSPQQAEVVRFAQLDGNISLVLRAPADAQAPTVDTTGITLRELVDQYGVLPPAPISPANP